MGHTKFSKIKKKSSTKPPKKFSFGATNTLLETPTQSVHGIPIKPRHRAHGLPCFACIGCEQQNAQAGKPDPVYGESLSILPSVWTVALDLKQFSRCLWQQPRVRRMCLHQHLTAFGRGHIIFHKISRLFDAFWASRRHQICCLLHGFSAQLHQLQALIQSFLFPQGTLKWFWEPLGRKRKPCKGRGNIPRSLSQQPFTHGDSLVSLSECTQLSSHIRRVKWSEASAKGQSL